MLQEEHSEILLTFIRLPFVINFFVLSIFSGCFTQVLLYSAVSAWCLSLAGPIVVQLGVLLSFDCLWVKSHDSLRKVS